MIPICFICAIWIFVSWWLKFHYPIGSMLQMTPLFAVRLALPKKYICNCSKQQQQQNNRFLCPQGIWKYLRTFLLQMRWGFATGIYRRAKACCLTPCNAQDSCPKIKLLIAPKLRNPAGESDHFSSPPLPLLAALFSHLNCSYIAVRIVSILTSV